MENKIIKLEVLKAKLEEMKNSNNSLLKRMAVTIEKKMNITNLNK
jgi:hypothetical protein